MRGRTQMKQHKKYKLGMVGLLSAALLLGACQSKEVVEVKPPVQENMKLESEQTGDKIDTTQLNQTYVVKEGDYNTFLESYEKQYKEDGWDVVLDAKPDFMTFEKEGKQVKVMPVETEEGIKVFLYEEVAE